MGGTSISSSWLVKPAELVIACLQRAAARRPYSNRLTRARLSYQCAGVLLAAALFNCSGSPFIDFHAADYRDTEAFAGDSQPLLNILRAKDDLPIHFADLSIIHGSIQLTATGTATLPFAHLAGSTTPSSFGPTLGAQTQPTFDVGTLDTQDFTRGMLSPVSPQIIKQLFDQGVDPRIIMILFFSEYRNHKGRVFQNNMSCDLSQKLNAEGECKNRIYDFLDQIDALFEAHQLSPTFTAQAVESRDVHPNGPQHLYANVFVPLSPIGGELSGPWTLKDNLQDLRQLDTTKFKLIDKKTAKAAGVPVRDITPDYKRLFIISEPRLAICYETNGYLKALFPTPAGDLGCRNNEVVVQDRPSQTDTYSIRSSYEILQFLGQVLRFQQEKRVNRCLTLSVERNRPETRTCDRGEVLFQVNSPRGPSIVGTRYDGAWYTVNYRSCNKEHNEPCDYSLQVLAILELLLNANKAARDIPSTPRVQVVP
jgi:hypothetical protein